MYRPLTSSRARGQDKNTCDGGESSSSSQDGSTSHMVGENQNLEKPYLRLTTFPKKEDVRPLEVLIKSLAHIKSRYIQDEDFEWSNEQLKSVRQDLTVQGIRNHFVLDVYETHARILLENGDLNEFNQCQTMIRSLTTDAGSSNDVVEEEEAISRMKLGHGKKKKQKKVKEPPTLLRQSPKSEDEFRGYALLYALVQKTSLSRELTRCAPTPKPKSTTTTAAASDMKVKVDEPRSKKKRKRNKAAAKAHAEVAYCSGASPSSSSPSSSSKPRKSSFTGNDTFDHENKLYFNQEAKAAPPTFSPSSHQEEEDEFESSYEHALKVVKAVSNNDDSCDYRTFFRLYASAPYMSAFLLDFLVKRVRDQAFLRIISAYRPNVSVEQFREWLCFSGDSGLQETRDFLRASGAVFLQEAGSNDATSPAFWVDCKATRKELSSSSDSFSS